MKKILRGVGVLLIAVFMIFSPIAIADTGVKINKSNIKTTNNSADYLGFELTKGTTDTILDVENYVWDGVNAQWVDADETPHRVPINTQVWLRIVIHNLGPSHLLNVVIEGTLLLIEFLEADPPPDDINVLPPNTYVDWDVGHMQVDEKFEVIILARVLGPVTEQGVFHVYSEGMDEWGERVFDYDLCIIQPYKISRNIAIPASPLMSILRNFFQNHPNLFPILRQPLGS